MYHFIKNYFLLFITVLFISACGGGGGGGGDTGGGGTVTPIGDVSGSWSVDETTATTNCQGEVPGTTTTNTYALNLTGSTITLISNGNTYSGTMDGNRITGSASYPEDGGTTTASVDSIVADSCDSFTGTTTWSWTDGVESCNGTTSLTGTRNPAQGCGSGSSATIPEAPTSVSANATSDTTVRLTWTDASDNETGFKISRGTISGGSGSVEIATTASGVTSFNDTGLTADTQYYYFISSFNTAGASTVVEKSVRTNLVSISIPDVPTASVIVNSSSSISLLWSNVANESSYEVAYKKSFETLWTPSTTAANTTSKTFIGLTSSTSYDFRVRATNSAGSSAYRYVSGTTLAVTLPKPVLTAPSTSTGSIGLSWSYDWSAGGGLVSSADGYEVQEAGTRLIYSRIYSTLNQNDRVSPKTFTVIKTTSGTYNYRVRARKNGVYSPWSTSRSVVVTIAPVRRTATFDATRDNLLLNSSVNSSIANTAYPSSENAVGCNWSRNLFISTYVCATSLIRFDVSSLNGKRVISAKLKLSVDAVPATAARYRVWAIFDNWGANVTWNTMPRIYSGSDQLFNSPTSAAIPHTIDVTSFVTSWLNSSRNNYGFMLEDGFYQDPGRAELQATSYCSLNSCGGGAAYYPKLEITYE